MDNAYQFGSMQVTCEGYEYPDDPYVLKGSCGVSADCTIVFITVYVHCNLCVCVCVYVYVRACV